MEDMLKNFYQSLGLYELRGGPDEGFYHNLNHSVARQIATESFILDGIREACPILEQLKLP